MDMDLYAREAEEQAYQNEKFKFQKALKDDVVGTVKPFAQYTAEEEMRSLGYGDADVDAMKKDTANPYYVKHSALHQKKHMGEAFDALPLGLDEVREIRSIMSDKDDTGRILDPQAGAATLQRVMDKYQGVPGVRAKVLAQLGVDPTLVSLFDATNGGYNDFYASYISTGKREAGPSVNTKMAGQELAGILGLKDEKEGLEVYDQVKAQVLSSQFMASLFDADTGVPAEVRNRIIFSMAKMKPTRRAEVLSMMDRDHEVVPVHGEYQWFGRGLDATTMSQRLLGLHVEQPAKGMLVLPKGGVLTPGHVAMLSSDSNLREVRALALGIPPEGFSDYQNIQAAQAAGNLGIRFNVDAKTGLPSVNEDGTYTVTIPQRADVKGGVMPGEPQKMTKEALDRLVSDQVESQFGLDNLVFANKGDEIVMRAKNGDGRAIHKWDHAGLANDITAAQARVNGQYADTVGKAVEKIIGREARKVLAQPAAEKPEYGKPSNALAEVQTAYSRWIDNNLLMPSSIPGVLARRAGESAKDTVDVLTGAAKMVPQILDASMRFGAQGQYFLARWLNTMGESIKRNAREGK